jgi:hypothetical protein
MAAFFLLFPRYYDPSLGRLRDMLAARLPERGKFEALNLWTLASLPPAQADDSGQASGVVVVTGVI